MISTHTYVPKRILIIKLRYHGDILLITPVINRLKKNWPDAEIGVLLYHETREILAASSSIAHLIAIDRQWKKKGLMSHLTHEWQLLKQLRTTQYDLVINLADQWRSAIASRWTGAHIRLGFDFPKRRTMLWRHCHTQLVSVEEHSRLHTVEQNLSLLEPLNIPDFPIQVTMSYDEVDWQYAILLLHQNKIGKNYILLQPTSRWFFKCWSEEKMAAVVAALQAEGHTLVITSGPDRHEQDMVDAICLLAPQERVISLAGKLSQRQLAALIDHAQLFIGVDSVPMHMAAALNTPYVALFGPSKLTFWRPWQGRGAIIWAGDYGPLPDPDEIDTKTSVRYLDIIPIEVVIDAAKELLV